MNALNGRRAQRLPCSDCSLHPGQRIRAVCKTPVRGGAKRASIGFRLACSCLTVCMCVNVCVCVCMGLVGELNSGCTQSEVIKAIVSDNSPCATWTRHNGSRWCLAGILCAGAHCGSKQTVACGWRGLPAHRLPPATRLAPSFLPESMKPITLSYCCCETSGPCPGRRMRTAVSGWRQRLRHAHLA